VVTTAAVVSGSLTPPGATNPNATIGDLPAFCRVAATLKPTADSEIRTEIWLPMSGWNRRLQSVGNGAWAGTIPYAAMAAAVTGGYATAGTDTGHTGNTASFAPGHPERLVDYGYRGVHEMTVAAKAIVRAFYGDGPRYSYWNGGSTGGRQGLMEAQRYPADYDGVIAGAPVNARVHRLIWELWVAQAVHRDDASCIPPVKYRSLNDAVLAKCDGNDGAKDGLLTSPDRCSFDPGALQCKAGDAESCLTTAQVEAARKICAMCGWFSEASTFASRSKRVSRSASQANASGRTLIAALRSSLVSRALYTSPIPPAPSGATTSYGPRRVPVARDIGCHGFYLVH
jgi:tannase/feruloyl esterase